jgi:hypothetical protein
VVNGLYLNETNMIKCNYLYSQPSLTTVSNKLFKNNIKNKTSKSKTFYKKRFKVCRPASRQQIHTYYSRFVSERVAETSQIFLRATMATNVLPKLPSYENTANVAYGKPITILPQSISGVSDVNRLVAFFYSHGREGEK